MDSNNLGDFYENSGPEDKNDPAKKRKIKYVILTVVIIFIALGVFYWIGTNDTDFNVADEKQVASYSSNTPIQKPETTTSLSPTSNTTVESITIDDSSQKLVPKSSGYCSALAPQDWTISSDQSGRGVDIYNSDQTVGAGWFIAPILFNLYGEPDQAITTIMQALGNDGYTFTNSGEEVEGGFIMREFSATNQGRSIKGIGLYKKYPIDDSGYVLSYYQSATTTDKWDSQGGLASEVALSIRCTAQITPSADDGFDTSTSVSDTSDKASLSDSWSERAILGQETVHSSSTGETYSVSSSDYSDTGLQGGDPGYYRTIDSNGTVERLESGFGDY